MDQVAVVHGAKASVGVTTRGVTRKRLQVSEADPSKGSRKKKKS